MITLILNENIFFCHPDIDLKYFAAFSINSAEGKQSPLTSTAPYPSKNPAFPGERIDSREKDFSYI